MKPEREDQAVNTGLRRKFLLGATIGSAGAVAAAVAGGKAKPVAEAVASAVAPTAEGYRLTAHIQQYYDTTRI